MLLDSFVIQIASIFLFVNLLFLCFYLLKERRADLQRGRLKPRAFFMGALAALCLTAVFTGFLGLGSGLLAFDLAAGIVLSLVQPVVAVSFLIAVFFLRPWELMPLNPMMLWLPRGLAAVTLISWLIHGMVKKKLRLEWNLSCTFYFALLVWLSISTVFTQGFTDSIETLVTSFFPTTVIALLVLNAPEDELDLSALTGTLAISISGVIAMALYMTFKNPLFAAGGLRLTGPGLFGNANDLAALIVLALPLTFIALFVKNRRWLVRGLAFICLVILGLGLWFSQSRGALAALLLAALAYVIFSVHSKRWVPLALVLVCLAPLLFYVAIRRSSEETEMSRVSRWNYVVTGLRMVKSYPLFGVGVGNYPRYYNNYTNLFYEEGQRTAHSSWVLIAAEAGPPGFFLFLGLFLTVLWAAWRLRSRAPQLFLPMISYGVAMSLLSHVYLFLPYLVFAFVLAGSRVLIKNDTQPRILQPAH